MGYSKFALAFLGDVGREQIRCSLGDVGSRGTHNVGYFIFPSLMTKSDKKKTPSGWDAWSAWMATGLSILGAHPGSSSQWAMLGRLLCVGLELRFCSLRL